MITAFQASAYQNNAFQIGGNVVFQGGSKGNKYDESLWEVEESFEEQYRLEAVAILLLIN